MAKYGADRAKWVLVGGYNLTSDLVSWRDRVSAILEDETHSLGDSWRESLAVGVRRVELESDGFYDDRATGLNEALAGNETVEYVVTWCLTGGTIGDLFNGVQGAFGGTFERTASVNALHRGNGVWTVTGVLDTNGVILHNLTAETADGDTEGASSQDNGSSSSNGGAGYLQITSLTLGTATNLAITIRDSSDDITYGNLLSFTVATAAPTAERVTVSGTVERHLAAEWSWTGGAGGGSSAVFMVGFKRD